VIEAEFGMSEYTARNFMQVAKVYGEKIPTVGNLPPTALYALAAPKTPIEVREEIESMIAAGEVVTKATVTELRDKLSGLEKGAPVSVKWRSKIQLGRRRDTAGGYSRTVGSTSGDTQIS